MPLPFGAEIKRSQRKTGIRLKRDFELAILLIILFLLLIFLNTFAGNPPAGHINDYLLVHIAGNALRHGMDLYNPQQWELAHTLFGNGYTDNPVFIYPLPFAFFFIPFSFLSIPLGEVVWLLVGEGLFIFCIALLLRGMEFRSLSRFALLAISIGIFLPVINVWWARQHSFLLFFFLVATFIFLRDGKDAPGGIMLALLALRPGAVVYLVPAVLAWAALQRRWRVWFASGVASLTLLAVSWLIRPGWPAIWFDYTVGDKGKLYSYLAYVPTLWGMLNDFDVPASAAGKWLIGGVVTLAVIGFSVFWLRKHKATDLTAVTLLFVPASLFLSFYAWNYDQLFLLLPLLLTLWIAKAFPEKLKTLAWTSVIAIMVALPYLLRIVALQRGRDSLSALLPLAVWALGLWVVRIKWREWNANP